MAGESPDRSKQRESSAEQTSGSAGPVPEKQDPRLAVARETDGPESRKADTATRVLSVREASASEPEETPASDDADADAQSRDDGAQSRDDGAQDGDGRLREAVAAWVRTAEPKDAEKASQSDADADEGADGDNDVSEGADDREDASGADGEDEDVKPAASDENEGGSTREGDAAAAAGAGEDHGDDDGPSGDATADTAASDDATSDEGRGDAPKGDAPKGEAPRGKDAEDDAGEAKAGAPEAADGKAATAKADEGKGDARTSDGRTGDKAADGKAATPANDEEAGHGKAAAPKDHSEADDGKATAPKDDAKSGDAERTDKTGDAKTGDAKADDSKGDENGGGAKAGADAPVDQPTAVFRAPRPAEPAVDQPTTMLKLGDAATRTGARAAEAERTSKFVALKPDPAIGQTPRQGGPAPAESTTFLPQVGPERTTQQPLPPKPPLDLLAELTNTPPPPQTPLRTAVRRVKIWTPLVVLLVIVFAVVQNFRPLPTPTLVLTAQDSYTFEGGKPQIPWPDSGQAALDVDGIGTFGSSGEQKPVPIASVAKVMTAYVILRDHPLKSGADGPKIKVDALAEKQSDAGQESTVNVTEGDAISEREAIEAILIASANNVARLLARWDAGSEAAFVEKMNQAAEDLGMSDTTYTDPSGLNDTTVSTAVDQVKLARAAMQQPAFREVAAMMEYTDYKGEKHGNWNRLVGRDDVVGIKTGTTTSALGNLSFAAKKDVDGEVHRIVGAVLRQPEGGEDNTILSGALDAGHQLILAGQDALRAETILKKGTVVGYADDGLGGHTPVVVTEDVKAVGWAGLEVKLTFAGTELPHTAKAGTKVGTLTVGDGKNGAVKVPVALKEDLVEPGFTDKLTRVA
ncbi:D-alanyl-D-alanine carboxypeptidase [Streptomyces albogriseolus]|uniref:D-alanyl-D-alanine carboxypeptidase n=1 Tax=Streptomyces albogriseolus TaxID=1887 RepID=UPI00339EB2C3